MAVTSCPTVLYFSPATTDYRPFLSFCYGMNVINNFSNKYLVAKEKTANKKSVFHERISGLILNFRQVLSCYDVPSLQPEEHNHQKAFHQSKPNRRVWCTDSSRGESRVGVYYCTSPLLLPSILIIDFRSNNLTSGDPFLCSHYKLLYWHIPVNNTTPTLS